MENVGFRLESRIFFIYQICKMKKIMKEKNQVVPDEVLSKELLIQFKTEADVSKFLKRLHAQMLEKMLEGDMDAHWSYEKNSVTGTIPATPGIVVIRKKSRPNMESLSFLFYVTVTTSLSR